MKKFLYLLIIAAPLYLAFYAAAQGPAVSAPAAAAANDSTGATQTITPQATTLPPVQDFLINVADKYNAINSYSMTFSLVQTPKPSNLDDDKKKALRNDFKLMLLDENPQDKEFMMRLEAIRGHHQKTVVLSKPDDNNEYKYFVYKPSGVTVLKPDDPRVLDIPQTDIRSFVRDIITSIPTSQPSVQVNAPAADNGNGVVFEAISDTDTAFLQLTTDTKRVISYFDLQSFSLTKQETYVKTKKNFLFKQLIEWKEFSPGEINPDEITAIPDLK